MDHPEKIKKNIEILNLQQVKAEKAFWRLCLFDAESMDLMEKINALYQHARVMNDDALDYLYEVENLSNFIKINESGKISVNSRNQFNVCTSKYYEKFEKHELSNTDIPKQLMIIIRSRFIEIYQ